MFEDDQVKTFAGDQADRSFWSDFKKKVPTIDIVIVIDDGHQPHQQIVTHEEMLPHVHKGGVYLCEDIQSHPDYYSDFDLYLYGFLNNLNKNNNPRELSFKHREKPANVPSVAYLQEAVGGSASSASPFQAEIHSVHMYPFVVVIEKTMAPVKEFICAKHGTQGPSWNP